jgi:hypothetical protein
VQETIKFESIEELTKKYDLIVKESDHDYHEVSNLPVNSEFQNAVMEYVGGFAVRMASKKIKCEICVDTISQNHKNERYELVHAKIMRKLIRFKFTKNLLKY